MDTTVCSQCEKTKATLECGLCSAALCKNCASFVDEASFSFLESSPRKFAEGAYCNGCYTGQVEPELQSYEETMEAAKDISVFYKTQAKETRLMKRKEKPVKVASCEDRDETLLRLAFQAVRAGCNALIDVELIAEKVITGGYQKSNWRGIGIPTQIDEKKLAP